MLNNTQQRSTVLSNAENEESGLRLRVTSRIAKLIAVNNREFLFIKRQGFENRNVTPLDRFSTYVPLRKFSGKPHNRFSLFEK